MKRIIAVIASLLLVMSVAGIASAEMVNIGVAAIDESIDEGIRARVAGVGAPAAAAATQPAPRVNIGVAEIEAADYAALQDYVSGRRTIQVHSEKAPPGNKIRIEVVDISQSDLQDLEKMTSWMKGARPGQLLMEKLQAQVK